LASSQHISPSAAWCNRNIFHQTLLGVIAV